jgi:DNA topoisomerase-1
MLSVKDLAKYSLLIVESPAKCKKIKEYAGPGYECVASFGHIRELPHINNIDVAGNTFAPTYVAMKSKADQLKIIKKMADKKVCKEVIIATDDDREGEAIGWHLCIALGLDISKTKRILFREISRAAIQHAITHPGRINMALVQAQQCRQILDVLVGFTISPKLWTAFTFQINEQGTKSAGKKGDKKTQGLSAGRCQTPALRLVYDNYVSMKASPGSILYKTTGLFTSQVIPFIIQTDFEEADVEAFLGESMGFAHQLSISSPVLSIRKPPTPFTTASLLQAASNELHMGPKETMRCAQTLYENGLITYMRTDCEKYSAEFLDSVAAECGALGSFQPLFARNICTNLHRDLGSSSSSSSSEKSVVETGAAAHEAIRPVSITIQNAEIKDASERVIKLYELIWTHTLESCMAPAQVHVLRAHISAPLDRKYAYSCEQVVVWGWKCVNHKKKEQHTASSDTIYRFLQQLGKSKADETSTVKYASITCAPHLVQTKPHLTESRLIQMLKDRGIARPSTFAAIVDKIQEKGYVKKQDIAGLKKMVVEYSICSGETHIGLTDKEQVFGREKDKLVIQSMGILVAEFCVQRWPVLFDYDYTNQMETRLDEIACCSSSSSLENTDLWAEKCVPLYQTCMGDMAQQVGLSEDADNKQIALNKKFGIPITDADAPERKLMLIVGKNGPVIMDKSESKATFISVKKDLAWASLAETKKEIFLHDVIENLEKIKDEPGFLQNNKNNNGGNEILENKSGIIRVVNKEISIRQGKNGKSDYIFYKTLKMVKPRFISLAKFPHNYMLCDEALIVKLC